MKIYQDPELPDVDAIWDDMACDEGTTEIDVTLVSEDSDARPHVTAPCDVHGIALRDVPRERYHVVAYRKNATPLVSAALFGGVDLRDGFDEDVYLLYNPYSNVHVGWRLPDGLTCDDFGYAFIQITTEEGFAAGGGSCTDGEAYVQVASGIHEFQILAATDRVFAASAKTAPTEIDQTKVYELGTLDLALCGADCPMQ